MGTQTTSPETLLCQVRVPYQALPFTTWLCRRNQQMTQTSAFLLRWTMAAIVSIWYPQNKQMPGLGSPSVCICLLPENRTHFLLAQIVDIGPRTQEFYGNWSFFLSREACSYLESIRKTSHFWKSCNPCSQPRPSFHHLVLHFHPTSCLHLSNITQCMTPFLPPLIHPAYEFCQVYLLKQHSMCTFYFNTLPRISATIYSTFYCSEPTISRTSASLRIGSAPHIHLCSH